MLISILILVFVLALVLLLWVGLAKKKPKKPDEGLLSEQSPKPKKPNMDEAIVESIAEGDSSK